MTENDDQQSGTQEINPAQRGSHGNEVPMPEQRTGDVPPSPGMSRDNQQSGRDTEEAGKWDGETR